MSASKYNIVIIQARMGSTRLPGKVLMNLGGKTVLRHVIERCQAIPDIHDVCCAVPDTPQSEQIITEALQCGALISKGDEFDVLGRYYKAAKDLKADNIIRITSDCPLTDPNVSGQVLKLLIDDGYDYTCNNMPPSYPHGLDCEAFTFSALELAYQNAQEPNEREHVTPWLRNSLNINRKSLKGPGGNITELRWTLDFIDDFNFFEALFNAYPGIASTFDYNEIIERLSERPDISELNSIHHNVSRPGIRTA